MRLFSHRVDARLVAMAMATATTSAMSRGITPDASEKWPNKQSFENNFESL